MPSVGFLVGGLATVSVAKPSGRLDSGRRQMIGDSE